MMRPDTDNCTELRVKLHTSRDGSEPSTVVLVQTRPDPTLGDIVNRLMFAAPTAGLSGPLTLSLCAHSTFQWSGGLSLFKTKVTGSSSAT